MKSLGIPVIADGGIRFSGDSQSISRGCILHHGGPQCCGTEEAPGETELIKAVRINPTVVWGH